MRLLSDVAVVLLACLINPATTLEIQLRPKQRQPTLRPQSRPRDVGVGPRGGIHVQRPQLRGELHKASAILYPPLGGLPLFLRASTPSLKAASLVFSLAVEGILGVSATLHTFPWRREGVYRIARKVDYAMIFVGIALFYSSLGRLLLGAAPSFGTVEAAVWTCAAAGVALKCVFLEAPRWLEASIFLAQGWAGASLLPALVAESPAVVGGGLCVTLGAVAYGMQWPNHPRHISLFGPHEVFHLSTVACFLSFWWAMWMRVGL